MAKYARDIYSIWGAKNVRDVRSLYYEMAKIRWPGHLTGSTQGTSRMFWSAPASVRPGGAPIRWPEATVGRLDNAIRWPDGKAGGSSAARRGRSEKNWPTCRSGSTVDLALQPVSVLGCTQRCRSFRWQGGNTPNLAISCGSCPYIWKKNWRLFDNFLWIVQLKT